MTVGKLIAELKKYPKNMKVGAAAHDNLENEIQGIIIRVDLLKEGEAKDQFGDVVVLKM